MVPVWKCIWFILFRLNKDWGMSYIYNAKMLKIGKHGAAAPSGGYLVNIKIINLIIQSHNCLVLTSTLWGLYFPSRLNIFITIWVVEFYPAVTWPCPARTPQVVFFANTLLEMIRWWLYKQAVITLVQLPLVAFQGTSHCNTLAF